MPLFLEELNLWSWTAPQECYYCSTHWFNSAGGPKAGWKRGVCIGLLLVQSCFIIAEEKRTGSPLFPEDKPRTWRLLWGAGCCVVRWLKKMLPSPPHSTVWPAEQVAVKLLEALRISWTSVLPRLLTLSQSFLLPWPKVLFSAEGFSWLLFSEGIFFASWDLFWGFLSISRVCCVREQLGKLAAGKAWALLVWGFYCFLLFSHGILWKLFKYNISADTNPGLFLFHFLRRTGLKEQLQIQKDFELKQDKISTDPLL